MREIVYVCVRVGVYKRKRERETKCQNLISKVSDDKMRGDLYRMIYNRTNKQTSKQTEILKQLRNK